MAPVPEGALAAMKNAAAFLARDRCTSANRRLDVIIKALDERPKEGVATVGYTKLKEDAESEQDRWPKVVEDVRELHVLLRRHGARVSTDDEVQLDLLQEKLRRLARALSEATGFIEQRRASVVSGMSAPPVAEDTPGTPSSARSAEEAAAPAACSPEPEAIEQEPLDVTRTLGLDVEASAEEPLDAMCGFELDASIAAEGLTDECAGVDVAEADDPEQEEAAWSATAVPNQPPTPLAQPSEAENTQPLDTTQLADPGSKEAWRRSRTVRFATSPGGRVMFEELRTPKVGPD
uniref:Uncharacterized protein n=1 Tax=Alexandrium andersonii TaxID=327968 RepID=A0A7S2JAE3_9DINO